MDNYCFAEECYGENTMYNSIWCYTSSRIISNGAKPPGYGRRHIVSTTKITYAHPEGQKEFAHDASIIQTLVSEGYVTGELKKGSLPSISPIPTTL